MCASGKDASQVYGECRFLGRHVGRDASLRSKEIMDNEEFWIELSDCGEWGYMYIHVFIRVHNPFDHFGDVW